jgi:hypothetical protein
MQCLFCGKESIVLIQILVNLGVIYHMKGGLQSKFFTLPQMVRMWDGLSLQLRKKSTGMSQKKVQKGFFFLLLRKTKLFTFTKGNSLRSTVGASTIRQHC